MTVSVAQKRERERDRVRERKGIGPSGVAEIVRTLMGRYVKRGIRGKEKGGKVENEKRRS